MRVLPVGDGFSKASATPLDTAAGLRDRVPGLFPPSPPAPPGTRRGWPVVWAVACLVRLTSKTSSTQNASGLPGTHLDPSSPAPRRRPAVGEPPKSDWRCRAPPAYVPTDSQSAVNPAARVAPERWQGGPEPGDRGASRHLRARRPEVASPVSPRDAAQRETDVSILA